MSFAWSITRPLRWSITFTLSWSAKLEIIVLVLFQSRHLEWMFLTLSELFSREICSVFCLCFAIDCAFFHALSPSLFPSPSLSPFPYPFLFDRVHVRDPLICGTKQCRHKFFRQKKRMSRWDSLWAFFVSRSTSSGRFLFFVSIWTFSFAVLLPFLWARPTSVIDNAIHSINSIAKNEKPEHKEKKPIKFNI